MTKTLNTLAAIFLTTGLAHAESVTTESPSCRQARDAAWFQHQLARTEGNVEPIAPYLACDTERQNVVASAPTCKETRDAAWFQHQMARTEGNVEPVAPYVACDTDLQNIAEAGRGTH